MLEWVGQVHRVPTRLTAQGRAGKQPGSSAAFWLRKRLLATCCCGLGTRDRVVDRNVLPQRRLCKEAPRRRMSRTRKGVTLEERLWGFWAGGLQQNRGQRLLRG